jgi:hypothetical protein
MKKTIDYLIERAENASRVTGKLGAESAEFAEWLGARMDDIGIKSLSTEDGYTVHCACCRTSVGNYHYLKLNRSSEYCSEPVNLSSSTISNGEYYVYGDFSCCLNYKTADETLEFVAHAEALLVALNEKISQMEAVEVPTTK